jgi:TPR repeat protein
MATETCENCKRIIGELEQAYTWQSHILCKECYARLSNPTTKQPIPVDVHTPIIQPTPQRSLVKSTLIVIATVIAVIVVISIILFIIYSVPSIPSRQTTIDKANKGDAYAQTLLGTMYRCGDGVPRDYKKAVTWYRKAAEQGNASAQSSLGEMYYFGYEVFEGVPQDYNEAVKWYTKAAEQGYDSDQFNLGEMYYDGKGVPQDYNEAVKWYTKAAEQGYAHAQFSLGQMYYYGKGAPKDYNDAFKWNTKAAEHDYASAQTLLGEMHYFGRGVPQDYNEAYKWALLAEMNGETGDIHKALKEMLADKITPTQIAEAHKLAREFTEKQEERITKKNTKVSGVK